MRLSHVTLFVSDVARSRDFYLALGFELLVDAPHYCRFHARTGEGEGDETISIEHRPARPTPAAQIGIEHPSREALDAYVTALIARGVTIAEGPLDRSWGWRDARVFDPDGHELMFFHAGANKLDPPWSVRRAGA